ncbi:MAG: vWA domain-containing protein, partial [Anaerolineae bacterium]
GARPQDGTGDTPPGESAFRRVNIGPSFKARRWRTTTDRRSRDKAGKRTQTISRRKRGRYIRARRAPGDYDDIALDATLREAAPHQRARRREGNAITILDRDLHRKVRVRQVANLVVFAVDASWSMAAAERMEATKGAILSLLVDAYQKRDRVCLITFQNASASIVLPPTSNISMARRALADIPVGGKTPLSAGLLTAYQVIQRQLRQDREAIPLLVLMTDGAGNVSLTGMEPRAETLMLADLFARDGIRAMVLNTEHPALDRGLAQEIAEALRAPCHTLDQLRADYLYQTVRKQLQ